MLLNYYRQINNDNKIKNIYYIINTQCKSIDERSTTRHPSENERKVNRHDVYSSRLTLLDVNCNVIFLKQPPPSPPTMTTVDHSTSATSKSSNKCSAVEQIRQQNSQMKELREERDQLLDHITGVEEKHATFKAMNEDNIKLGTLGKTEKRAASEKIAGTQHPPECPDMELIGNS